MVNWEWIIFSVFATLVIYLTLNLTLEYFEELAFGKYEEENNCDDNCLPIKHED
jgi:hypothetical protein